MGESYACASGGSIHAGRSNITNMVGLMGDSLTADSYGLTNFPVTNARTGGKLKLLANSGVASETVGNMLSRIDNSYTAGSPGFGGLPMMGRIFVRAGTNNARSNNTIASISATYTSLLNALATYARRVVILAVPPLANTTNNSHVITYNAWLSAFAASNSTVFKFVDDCVNIRNGDDSIKAEYFNVDGIHFIGLGTAQTGVDAAAALDGDFDGYISPVSKDPLDVYPAQPQWFVNPTMAGTSGTKGGGFTGTVATGMNVGGYGSGMAGVCSIVSADEGDENQTPWQRVALSAGNAGSALDISSALVGRTVTSVDPASLEAIVECRMTSVDKSKISNVTFMAQANNGEFFVPNTAIHLPDSGLETHTYVSRHNRKRSGSSVPAAINLHIYTNVRTTFAGSVGTLDFRCITLRG